MNVEVLVIRDCPHASDAVDLVWLALDDIGIPDATVRMTLIESAEQAVERRFSGSPTFLLDGQDPFAPTERKPELACRLYRTDGGLRGVPDIADLGMALEAAADVAQ